MRLNVNTNEERIVREEAAKLQAEIARLREALAHIAKATNVDDSESYRCDDREGCLDYVYAKAVATLDNSGQDAGG
jgi:hypothetical protein